MRKILIVFSLGVILLFTAACGGGGNGAASQEDQVAAGQTVYTESCAECHDPGGVGPQLQAANLSAYGTAQGLFDYISTTMPQDAPGSLTDQQYYDVTAHLLSNTGLLPADQVVGADTAANISLTQ